jgi:hypothetical protein
LVLLKLDAKFCVAPEVTDNLLVFDLLKTLNCSIDLVNMKICIPLYTTNENGMISLINSLPNVWRIYQLSETISAQFANVPAEYRGDVANLLNEYTELFRTELLGTSKKFEHRIELYDLGLVRMILSRVPLAQYKLMKNELERMLRLRVICNSMSSYACLVVLVKKKNNKTRFCPDFRCLSDKKAEDAYPPPHMLEIVGAFHAANFFTTLELLL